MRPTQDLVRGSLFSMLGERITGAKFLDLYAGTGAVGIEAWSRGAALVSWVEFHPVALRALETNVKTFAMDRCRAIRGDVLQVLARGLPDAPFDIIFADPPYGERAPVRPRHGERRGGGGRIESTHAPRPDGQPRNPVSAPLALEKVLDLVTAGAMLVPGGWLVMEQGADEPAVASPGWLLVRDRRYGQSRLRVLERQE